MINTRKLYELLQAGLDALPEDQREQITNEPGTTAHRVSDDLIEFRAAGITYATASPDLFDTEAEWTEFVEAHA
ncbi:hypothetical protein [Rhodococcus sp. P1Y]|uniref:hypothetical protein n=1 Tax=Rhodococcus sp. P1Y TaxID=1302308 RepID=UPI000EAF0BCF|nr:hypothetical protein [Rhodococcus sp. P1Y]AYJ47509.1 hypothetical protein D8W71_03175 [Rhodococcus sp. P1Y]